MDKYNTDVTLMSAIELSACIASKDVSAVEVMQATLRRVSEVNGSINAIVSLRDEKTLLAEARIADETPSRGWLHGIPIAIKDLANVKGMITSRGSPLYADTVAEADDLMVARLRAAGALIIGKTNTPEFGLGSHTFNPVYGATRNPYNPERSAGGSSGGAAAALAAGMISVADGSDMMGSLRNPAAWNNVYGMRPTWGVVPPEPTGEMYFGQLSTAGPMARTPRDLAALLDTMAAVERAWPFGRSETSRLAQINEPVADVRIGWFGDWDGAFPMEDGILGICTQALDQMTHLKWNISSVSAPFSAEALWQSWIDLRSFRVSGESRPDYQDKERRRHLKPAMIWEIERGRSLSSEQIYQASMVRSAWFRRAVSLFDSYDALVLPSAQVWPFPVGEVHPTEIAGHTMDTYHRWMQVVVPASLIGLPVVNIPVGFGPSGLPMGVQLIGAPGSDAKLLRLAESWHQMTEWPQQRPACKGA